MVCQCSDWGEYTSYNDDQAVESAQLSTTYTSHSLRATSACRLFEKNVPEKIILEMSGHRSAAGMHAYKHTTADQHRAVRVTQVLESANENSTNDRSSMPVHMQEQPCQNRRLCIQLLFFFLDKCKIVCLISINDDIVLWCFTEQ